MKKVKILGYSERGVFNSIIYYLGEHPEYINGFIEAIGVDDDFFKDESVAYTFLNEQSFSEFGTCDLVIIAENEAKGKRVIFIEGKVKTEQSDFRLERDYDEVNKPESKKISSTIFAQLYYKYLLTKLGNEKICKCSKIGKQPKKLGENTIVNKAYEDYIKGAKQYFFVAILPEKVEHKSFQNQFTELALDMPTENIRCAFWGDIEQFFENMVRENMVRENIVLKTFEYNKGQIYLI
jgi:Holliday junction resolvase-like predicted endonuclease